MRALMPGSRAEWLIPVALLAVGLVARAWAASQVTFPPTEGSAYYVGVARNMVAGHGMVSDALWSYATPPLVLPRPAFELWLPMASLIAALPMVLVGATFAGAQLGGVVLGALIAPMAWAVGREAATVNGLSPARVFGVALGSGLLAAVLGPFLVAAAGTDSTTPFLVFGVLAALLVPHALGVGTQVGGMRRLLPGLALGVVLGLAYLSRQEAIWIGAAVLILALAGLRAVPAGSRLRAGMTVLGPIVAGGLLMVVPWLLRDWLVFGSPFPGQALDNALLVRNEEIFSYTDRPTLDAFLGQGAGRIVGNQLAAAWHDLVSVLVVPAFPVGLIGLVSLLGLRHATALRRPTALATLLLGGGLTFVATALLFPVATLWGTFLHASGPLLVGLTVSAVLGVDAVVARVARARSWERPNVGLAPAALLAVTLPLAIFQVAIVGRQTAEVRDRMTAVAAQVDGLPGLNGAHGGPVSKRGGEQRAAFISDHPIWLSEVLGQPVIALPDEPPSSVAKLATDFRASYLVVFDARGRYPDALLPAPQEPCFEGAPVRLGDATDPAWAFRIESGCGS